MASGQRGSSQASPSRDGESQGLVMLNDLLRNVRVLLTRPYTRSGLHGYSHENPVSMTLEQQKDILDYTYDLLAKFNNGVPPKGSVAPWWETSAEGTMLLLDKGIEYDHSHMAHDSQAYYLRDEDTWTRIDYSGKAETWMKPLQRGNITGLVELPANWYLDDLPPMMFIKGSANSHGWVNSRDVEQLWKDTFTYLYREEEDFIFPITIHPDVSGCVFSALSTPSELMIDHFRYRDSRPHVLLMLERFIEWVNTHEDVHWVCMNDMANEFRAKNAPPAGARMPRGMESGNSQ
ncbi:hypothetical protein EVJ58_g10441 [Rhodofomes roseus]|uniref:Polysaccharide deacetylase n=1 Tax=Rhodofomes roseus TaxID=34475 RepID=A0A4Y9XR69_9APHY|nr:hypothetical protein EVJ58_g10441 [Rhodofomes roseus]